MKTKTFEIDGIKTVYYRKRHLKLHGIGINRLYRWFRYREISYPDVIKDEFQRIWISQNIINEIFIWVKS